ncbi:hypothetical protein [Prauserella cavernicola]|uniref:Uncharacterized protein n=1 Tax=Prauserella cavernicola TaxID=2800127 RepID=A0A934V4P7_9PSEU|nr:hypothetical protein [Prauserella cavernicola]MBK1783808.1 hypothetical protein [Prauserella cavernicola]
MAEATVVDSRATEQVCDGPVCVTAIHENELARRSGPGERALRLLATLPGAPSRIAEVDHAVSPDEVPPRAGDTVLVDLMTPSLRSATEPDDVTRSLLAGAGTPSCYPAWEETTDAALHERAARTVMAGWFTGEPTPLRGHSVSDVDLRPVLERSWAALRALPDEEQRSRVIAVREAGLTCRGDQLEILTGGTTG